MRIELLLRSSSLRLSIVYSGILLLAFAATGLLVYASSERAAVEQARERIELEVFALEEELRTESLEAMAAAIEARTSRPGALEYWLTAPDGHHLAGRLRIAEGPNGWREIETEGVAPFGDTDILTLTKTLPGGATLSVGEDLTRALSVQKETLLTLIQVGAAAALLALLAGVVATFRTLARMRMIRATLGRASEGDLSARVPTSSSLFSTDLDEIALGLNRMLGRTQDLVAGLRRVTRDVAHDLRTPLSHLRQRLERVGAADTDGERQEGLALTEAKVEQILASFDAILRLAEIEAGASRDRFVPVDVATLCEPLVDAYQPDVENGGRTLTLSADPAPAFGDALLLTQAIANLIENAMRHTPPGTAIGVSCGTGADGRSHLTVTDDGPGIPDGHREAMLEPFARLDPSRSTAGTGLGLSIVAAVATLHGADLALSDAGPGLSVRITFPYLRDAP
ncbi:sensory histidine protein kinase [Parvularcula bermudensis HTCC2503]|uniref:histidine kinase n=1 Tax=Parvularcula bermudensis (strain ATCC BAA-594 / HTCC2503 / KCTC 12087) TaxID=314260 RepID=E0TII1_PARBH|nr:ATP-binding protein [Parvularcula bermudensis]ADM10839.1 sensory histidine protein kinase [Parvularcula bermudensis HTCC2503]